MKYWRIFAALLLVLLVGIYLVADGLNQQLCCQAAPVLDVQVLDDNVRLTVLNAVCSLKILPVFEPLTELLSSETSQKGWKLLRTTAKELHEEALNLLQGLKSLGEKLWHGISTKLG